MDGGPAAVSPGTVVTNDRNRQAERSVPTDHETTLPGQHPRSAGADIDDLPSDDEQDPDRLPISRTQPTGKRLRIIEIRAPEP